VKAYVVSCSDDDHGAAVQFADTGREARQCGNGDNCDCGYIELRAKRAPYLDQYAPGPVSILTLMSHGWYAFCQNCEKPVYDDCDGMIHDPANDMIYCSQVCVDRYAEYWKRAKGVKA
jgi:hypothetical protein